jgi:RNA polymerase sigma-70 factor, ECF subfamily
MTEAEHSELIRRAQGGDARAFEELLNLYYGIIFKMAFKFCGKKELAEDITQESCIKLARFIANFKGQSKFTSWLYMLVINTGRDMIKSSSRHNGENAEVLEFLPSISNNGEDDLHTSQVLAAISELPQGEREALMLVLYDGYNHAEAGEILGVKEGTISWRISEAKKKLNNQFGKEAHYG